ncbi:MULTISPECIES: Maf family protein [unclassified Brevundimonas]|jgi:septum formation protein|uniref:Maf family protein n=1 Tax=unclassified Brevundimonas TaxID=2622653 RepID=UPI000C498CA3|nr:MULTISPECIES: Maf family protein [unclassified Brevundimonas]MAL88297.1 septum formation inhibitor Maf [Brevundimonas sp.]|tara:strand:+ start:2285 stop:2893 length:609 start_codon:yes stop_codon:yes gene_type:complete
MSAGFQRQPLVLASASAARRTLMAGVGLTVDLQPADLDEEGLRLANPDLGPADMAVCLAEAKAVVVSRMRPGVLVLGGDQILEDDGVIVSKADDLKEIAARLRGFRGRTHHLHSGAALARDGAVVWRHVDTAALTVRAFSEAWLATYLEAEGAALTGVVGGYRLEGPGAQLFARIEGDYFTVLGLPLWAVLEALRDQGVIDR